jgi:hypothetical protein
MLWLRAMDVGVTGMDVSGVDDLRSVGEAQLLLRVDGVDDCKTDAASTAS